ncbi:unnamed protein product [Calicophoron daubneyi]|uniref:Cap-specific mRNA (nucleoside-2'-O-)-methyltransferase 1 n=1 Tax=Calicophoron daubneyi TaxID=300641 RepID=A0AAV2TQ56_CALDB
MTPAWWGLCETNDFSLPQCIEAVLGFANLHMMLSPLHELVVIGITPDKTEFLFPACSSESAAEASHDGQYDLLGRMNDMVRRRAFEVVNESHAHTTTVVLAGAVIKALCYYLRRCRELNPTKREEGESSDGDLIESGESSEKVSGRLLIIKAADDNPSQYLSLMNAVFTAQKLKIPIDSCVLPLSPPVESALGKMLDRNTTQKQTRHSSLFQQAADLTGGIYLHIPRAGGLLQYLLSVFLPSLSLRHRLLLPDISSSGLSKGVDFRAACFCHRRLIDLGYVCSMSGENSGKHILKRKSDDSVDDRAWKKKREDAVDDRAWKIMQTMGYRPGQGLGVNAQGVVEPIALSKQKGRRGLGLVEQSGSAVYTPGVLYKSTDPQLVWSDGIDSASADGDKIWCWEASNDDAVKRNGAHASLQHLLLSPLDPKSLGPAISSMDNQIQFCSGHLVREMLTYKNQLDHVEKRTVTECHERSNPYELIKKGIFLNRAAMKLANMDAVLHGLFTNAENKESILYFADVCAGPGGFSEYILWRRCNAVSLGSESNLEDHEDGDIANHSEASKDDPCILRVPQLAAKGFGLTLKGDCDFRTMDFLAGPSEAFLPHYGLDGDGDITKWANLSSFASLIGRSTGGLGVHILLADGGFDVSGKENLQEVQSKRIYLCQCLCALITLRPGGHFLTKLFDVLTEFSAGLIFLMGQVFEEVMIVKPVTSRPANSERYLVCKNLLSPASHMAGCLPAPRQKPTSEISSTNTNFKQKWKRPGQGRNPGSGAHTVPVADDKEYGLLDLEKTGAVGQLIRHFLAVNEALGSVDQSSAGDAKQDILRLCTPEALAEAEQYQEFLRQSNEEMIVDQCIALSKLLAFIHDPRLSEPRQIEVKKSCMAKWKMGTRERGPVPWPIMSANHSAVIHEILGDKERLTSLNPVPVQYRPNLREERCTSGHLARIDYLFGSHIVLVTGSPATTACSAAAERMLIYSRGERSSIYCTIDGDRWENFDQPTQSLRLPPGTLLWGQPTYEYNQKNGSRRRALMVFDIACVYGHDCRFLPYRERMKLAQRMADVVNFPGMRSSVRVPELRRLKDFPEYVSSLPLLPCKDCSGGNVQMHKYDDGMAFRPDSVLLVNHLAEPWSEEVSRTTGRIYYVKGDFGETTFDIPSDQQFTFVQTRFIVVPWKAQSSYRQVSVNELVEKIKWFRGKSDEGFDY